MPSPKKPILNMTAAFLSGCLETAGSATAQPPPEPTTPEAVSNLPVFGPPPRQAGHTDPAPIVAERLSSFHGMLFMNVTAICLLAFFLLAPAAFAQGNDTTTSSTVQGSVKGGVTIGAGTADETTTGSSGPQQVGQEQSGAQRQMQASSEPGPNGLFCSDIRDPTARSACESKKGSQR